MKLLTLNFVTCAVKSCKPQPAAFPLHIKDAELEIVETEFQPLFMRNILSRVEWPAMSQIANEFGLKIPQEFAQDGKSAGGEAMDIETTNSASNNDTVEEYDDETLKKLHRLLLETQMQSGKLVCGNCGHEYAVKDGIANFLLPAHLV